VDEATMYPNNGRKDSWWKCIMIVSLLIRKGKEKKEKRREEK
jgi:hypothetical protein